jgi:hypothetical protein
MLTMEGKSAIRLLLVSSRRLQVLEGDRCLVELLLCCRLRWLIVALSQFRDYDYVEQNRTVLARWVRSKNVALKIEETW